MIIANIGAEPTTIAWILTFLRGTTQSENEEAKDFCEITESDVQNNKITVRTKDGVITSIIRKNLKVNIQIVPSA